MEWKPIETAPKDGTKILLGRIDDGECGGISTLGWWQDEEGDQPDIMGCNAGYVDYEYQIFTPGRNFGNEHRKYIGTQPTHWMPLPKAPNVNMDNIKTGIDKYIEPNSRVENLDMGKYINDHGKECYKGVTADTEMSALEFHRVLPSSKDDVQYALHTNLGTLTVLDRMTGLGYRDTETGFRAPDGLFWLASGNYDVRESRLGTISDAIEWVKKHANNCKGI